ncbi:MAG: NADH-quinone oxidoreductase subunit L, partial [Fimbriimonas ginsengisoli]|nr:NADH-quinone oxidoreductase subunit L [Fimbriimonas ginsengisoli]
MNLFIVLMLVLVLAGNLAVMFIGWEGVGLCSYLLIGFWYRDLSNARAANKAFIVNRIGDWGMTLGMFLLVVLTVGNWDKLSLQSDRLLSFDTIFANMHSIFGGHPVMTTAIALLLFVGACGKSAQFPLYFWLPDAMAGPTPVSALIHAATMVTAGVFMVNRMHVVFEYSPVASAVMAAIGAFTAFFAALIAFGQTDIKRVLAYSTVSQLGFMFVACGAGVYWAGIFHVTTHAFFKALLFLGAGAVIYAMAHEQDMRSYGRLWKYLPITAATMFVAYLAISGVPGLSGYYSKEAILGGALAGEHATIGTVELGVYSGWLALFVAMLTAWYMTRLTWLTFFGKTERWRSLPAPEEQDHSEAHETHGHEEHGPDEHGFFYSAEEMAAREAEEGHEEHHGLDGSHAPREAPPSMTIPLIILAACSVGAGFYLEQGDKFKTWLYPSDLPVLEHVREHPNVLFRFLGFAVNLPALSIFAAACGIFCGVLIYSRGLPRREGWNLAGWGRFRRAARRQFGYDDALMSAAVDGGREVGQAIWLNFDAGIIDGAVNGIARLFGLLGSGLRRAQTGLVRSYALLMLIGGVALIG